MAPLKQQILLENEDLEIELPCLKGHGPIEAIGQYSCRASPAVVTMSERTWPH